MSEGWTPGPWWFSPHGAYGRTIAGETFPFGYIEAESAMPIFELDTVHKIKRAELHANARLIAAAPELYAALEALLFRCEFYLGKWSAGYTDDAIMIAAGKALAKARGENTEGAA